MKSKDTFKTLEASLIEWLKEDPNRADIFLATELEAYAHDNNIEQLVQSICCIAEAKGETLQLAKSAEVNKKALDKMLQEDAHPTWEKVLEALGYTFLETKTDPIPSF